MNAQFTKDQTNTIRMLLSMFHPDKCPVELKEYADGFTKAINKAKDDGIYGIISQILSLVAKYGITKDSKDKMPEAWAEFSAGPKVYGSGETGKGKAKAEPKKEKPEPEVKDDILQKARAKMEESGWDRSKMGSWLNLVYDLKGKAAKVYLDILFAKGESSGSGRDSIRDTLFDKLQKGKMSDKEFEDWLNKEGTDNTRRHKTHWDAIRKMANAIWESK